MTLKNILNPDFELFWKELKLILISYTSTDTVFNQYLNHNTHVDIPDGNIIRLLNLYNYLNDVKDTAEIMIIGEASGPWGCRFSGVPFTGEKHLCNPVFPLKGFRSSIESIHIKSKESPFSSRSADIFWEILEPYYHRIIVWDIFPLHSHKKEDLFSIRNPSMHEIRLFNSATELIISFYKPKYIISLGRKAHKGLNRLKIPSTYVRHPSYGGKAEFINGMNNIFMMISSV